DFAAVKARLGVPFFVKPANLGSSVGISKVSLPQQLRAAVEAAFAFDRKIIIEENVAGRELECAVMGNEEPVASIVGEVVSDASQHEFYSYSAKYLDEKGASLQIPAALP